MDTQTASNKEPQVNKAASGAAVRGSSDHSARSMLAGALVLGFLAGAAGGIFGIFYALKNPSLLNRTGTEGLVTRTVRVDEASAVVDVVKKASPAVVSIIVSRDISRLPGFGLNPFDPFDGFFGIPQPNQPNIQQVSAGSGFFISSDGLILTNKHVVPDESSGYTVITSDGEQYEAQVVARDPVNDLAIIRVDIKNAPVLELADSSSLQLGSHVVAIGNSLGQYQNTVTTGVISGIGRSITAGGGGISEQLEGVIQTDAAINPGNSGGPLLNLSGQVVGINTAIDQEGQLVGFAIQASDAKRAVESYLKLGKIVRPYLGIRYLLVTKAVAEQWKLGRDYGALVLSGDRGELAVITGSPASQAGIRENDIILSLNGQRIDPRHSIVALLKNINPGDTVSLVIFRDGNEITLNLKVGER